MNSVAFFRSAKKLKKHLLGELKNSCKKEKINCLKNVSTLTKKVFLAVFPPFKDPQSLAKKWVLFGYKKRHA